jgi:hypothetical protein
MFLFGLSTDEVIQAREGGYDPQQVYYAGPQLRSALDAVASGCSHPTSRAVPPDRGLAPLWRGHVHGAGRLPGLRALPPLGRDGYYDRAGWTRARDPERGEHGPLLERPTVLGYARDV